MAMSAFLSPFFLESSQIYRRTCQTNLGGDGARTRRGRHENFPAGSWVL
jgi:hypothetical protein